MGAFFRMLFLAALGWLVWRLIRPKTLPPHRPGSTPPGPEARGMAGSEAEKMVRCAVCGAHVDARLTLPRATDGAPVCRDHSDPA